MYRHAELVTNSVKTEEQEVLKLETRRGTVLLSHWQNKSSVSKRRATFFPLHPKKDNLYKFLNFLPTLHHLCTASL